MSLWMARLLLIMLAFYAANSASVLDHPVLFKMPALESDQAAETRVLNSLDSLRTFPGVITLFTGRLLENVHGFTHGLFARFPDQNTLLKYYLSTQFALAVLPQIPYLRGENSVDYNTVVNGDPYQNFPNEIIHMAMFRFKLGVSHTKIQDALAMLDSLPSSLPSTVLQITYGANLYDRDLVYSHAFVARLASANATADFYKSPSYDLVIGRTLKPLCLAYIEADLKPITTS